LVSKEVKDYVKGLYGQSPAPMDPEVRKKILGNETPITCRPADLLPPMLPTATDGVDPKLIKKEEDIISFCLFPEVALDYFKWRALPADQRPAIPADVELKKQEAEEVAQPSAPRAFLAPSDYQSIEQLLGKVRDLNFSQLTIQHSGGSISINAHGVTSGTVSAPAAAPAAPATTMPASAPAAAPAAAPAPVAEKASSGPTIDAPLNGTFYRSAAPGKPLLVEDGAQVKAGTAVCIVEAMKLFNEIKAPCDCRLVKALVEHGKPVKKGSPLFIYEKIG
jgi:oxaloacetate decarboxylase alpha subunit